MEKNSDLEDGDGRKKEEILRLDLTRQTGGLDLEVLPLRDREGKPEVIAMIPGVVVADPGMGIQTIGHQIQQGRVDLESHEGTRIAEVIRIEDGPNLAENAFLFQPTESPQDFLLGTIQ
jgi:hypothetical protein